MKVTINKFQELINIGQDYLKKVSELEMNEKESIDKWSKKEILGHLIDSGINNLQRFTEIQFEAKPYKITSYNQDELVKANDYQNAKTEELAMFWHAINIRILELINNQTILSLSYKIDLYDEISDLKFLMTDYVDHLEHHLNQIIAD